jgi:hypothetical protein
VPFPVVFSEGVLLRKGRKKGPTFRKKREKWGTLVVEVSYFNKYFFTNITVA